MGLGLGLGLGLRVRVRVGVGVRVRVRVGVRVRVDCGSTFYDLVEAEPTHEVIVSSERHRMYSRSKW